MKRTCTFIVFFICISVAMQAQLNQPEWTRNIGGSGWDWARSTRMVGTIIVTAGSTLSEDHDWSGTPSRAEDMFVVKMDIDGNIIWKKKFGGSGTDICYAVEITADGGYILAGSTTSQDGDADGSGYHAGTGKADFWIVKLNAAGEIEWQKAYGGSGSEEAKGITQTSDGGYAIVGWTDSNDGDVSGNRGDFDVWVVKISASGTLEWQQCLGGSYAEYGRDIVQTADGGYIVVSETYSNDGQVTGYHAMDDYPLSAYSDWWIVKLDSTGDNIEWNKCYGGQFSEKPFEISATNDGGFIITGDTESEDGDVPMPALGSYDIMLVKFDANGNTQWEQRLGGEGRDRAYSVIQTSDGGYAMLGTSESSDGDMSGITMRGSLDYILIKLGVAGNVEWMQSFGGSGDDEAMSLQQTAAGCFVIAGNSTSNDGQVSGNYGDADAWILNWCTYSAILPTKLGDFKARYDGPDRVVLEWTTLSEQNNDRFEVQRSEDGSKFFTVGMVKSPGYSNNPLRYGLIDRDFDEETPEVLYYRLRQVDRNGKVTLSQVVPVRMRTVKISDVKIWPNPSDGVIQVQLKNNAAPARATVYNASGQVVLSTTVSKGNNEVNLRGRNKGTYFIRVEDARGNMQIHQLILR